MIVLRDGRIIELTATQQDNLTYLIMVAPNLHKRVKVADEEFNLDDIVVDKQEIARLLQQKLT